MYLQLGQILLLIFAANGAPILARKIFGNKGNFPVDAGVHFIDGRRIFGAAKTWRGIFSAPLLVCPLALIIGLSLFAGALVAVGAMSGDLLSSFIKRRVGLPDSAEAPGLDQVPESLIPSLLLMPILQLGLVDVLVLVLLFGVLDRIVSKLLFRLGIRQRPY